MSADTLERSRAHIDRLYEETFEKLTTKYIEETFNLSEILEPYLQGPITRGHIIQARSVLAKYIPPNRCFWTPSSYHLDKKDEALCNFVKTLRRYYVSDRMRIDHENGMQFRSNAKKRKLQVYLACADERAYACEKYRQMIRVAKDLLENETDNDFTGMMGRLGNSLRCESCGRGQGKHARPGILVDNILKQRQQSDE